MIGLGCNNFGSRLDADATARVVGAALDAGVTHFDSAEMYGSGRSEEFLGKALGSRRDEAVIATKLLPRPSDEPYRRGVLADRIRDACDLSLRRLGTDRIDLYYQHYPDPAAPIEEALATLGELQAAGKVLHIACSNYDVDQLRTAIGLGKPGARFCATQSHWNLIERDVETDLVPTALAAGMGVVPYFPLASGLLSGKYTRGEQAPEGTRLAGDRGSRSLTDANFDRVDALTAFAEERGHTILELAIAWLAAQEGVASVIAGATRPEQVQANAAAAGWSLSVDDVAALPAV